MSGVYINGMGSVVWSATKGFTFFLQGKSLAATGATLSKRLTTPANAERLQLSRRGLLSGTYLRTAEPFYLR